MSILLSGANAFIDYVVRPEFKKGESVRAVITSNEEINEGTEILGRGFILENMTAWRVDAVRKVEDSAVHGFKKYEVVISYKLIHILNIDHNAVKRLDNAIGNSLNKAKRQLV